MRTPFGSVCGTWPLLEIYIEVVGERPVFGLHALSIKPRAMVMPRISLPAHAPGRPKWQLVFRRESRELARMRLPRSPLAILLTLSFTFAATASSMPHHLFIGTYTKQGSKGIYSLQLDGQTGQLSEATVAAETSNPTYLAFSPDRRRLYAVSESSGMAVGFVVSDDASQLVPMVGRQPSSSNAPCHLMTDATGRALVLANYHTGLVASLPLAADGSLGPVSTTIRHTGSSVNPDRQTSPHPHSAVVSPDNRFVFVCDLGTDKIYIYRLDVERATLTPHDPAFIGTPAGVGPRHLAFAPNGEHAFMISEMGATLTAYRYDGDRGTLVPLDTQSTLTGPFPGENKCAAVRVHPNGHFVYGSNRGADTIVVYHFNEQTGQLALVQSEPCGGPNPRDFNLSPDGRWLVVAHQDANTLKVFKVDSATGRITATPAAATVPTPVCVLFAN